MTPIERRRKAWTALRVAGAGALLLALSACGRFGAPRPGTEQGDSIGRLYELMFYAAIGVAAVVYGLILWSLLRYRRRGDGLPPQFRKHVPLEVLYTVIPVLIVGWLFYETVHRETPIDDLQPNPDVKLDVTGFQWQWRFDYPAYGVTIVGTPERPPEIWLPTGELVRVRLDASDVIHAFYVPDFLFKRDAIPGKVNEFEFRVDEEGVFRGECAEYCGLEHAEMNFTVRGVSPQDFDSWIAEQQQKQGESA